MAKIKGLKIASFNISGGFYIGNEETEYLDREAANSVDDRMLKQIIDTINNEKIDIICFQEIITTKEVKYIEQIVENTDLKFYDEYELSPCNLVKNSDCGIAILSKYPITNTIKELFPNPKLAKTTSSGNTYYTYDKGYMICTIDVGDEEVKVLTHHGFPYRRFNSAPELNKPVFDFFNAVISKNLPTVVTGDFNAENFVELTEELSSKYKRTINDITTVDGKSFDDICVLKDTEFDSKMIKLLSDHYIVITTIK